MSEFDSNPEARAALELSLTQEELISLSESMQCKVFVALYRNAPDCIVDNYELGFKMLGETAFFAAKKQSLYNFNKIIGFSCSEAVSSEVLDAAFTWLRNRCSPGGILCIPSMFITSEARAALVARGFHPHQTSMTSLCRGNQPIEMRPKYTDFSVEEIGPADAMRFGEVVARGFGHANEFARWPAALVGHPSVKAYLAYEGKLPISAGILYIDGLYGWLGFTSTIPEYRGRGAQMATLNRRLKDGLNAGLRGFITEVFHLSSYGLERPSLRNSLRAGMKVFYRRLHFTLNDS